MKRTLITALAIICLFGLAAYIALMNVAKLQDKVFQRAMLAKVSSSRESLYNSDSLDLVFCGSGSPMPDPKRKQACIAVFAGDQFYLIDTGPGSAPRLSNMGVPTGGLKGVLWTHYHSDHIGGIGEVILNSWAGGRKAPLDIWGPAGVEQVVSGFNQAYALEFSYRTAHHGPGIFPADGSRLIPHRVDVPSEQDSVIILDQDGLKITAFLVDHRPIEPALGYRIDYRGRSAIFSGDTVNTPNMVRYGKDVDVMVHEALSTTITGIMAQVMDASGQPNRANILREVPAIHTLPAEAARTANEANVQLLVFSHIVPPVLNRLMEKMFMRGLDEIRDPATTLLGFDGLHLSLPVGSDKIQVSAINR